MAKTATQPEVVKDLESLGYQQAGNFEASQVLVRFALDNIKGFPDDVPSESRDTLYKGYRKRLNELNPAKTYAVIGGHYVTPTSEQLTNNKVEKVVIGVEYAFSFTSQEFGKLAQQNPELHKLVKDIRERTSTYCSNRLADLKRAARKVLNAGKERKRVGNKNFSEFIDEFFTSAFDRLRTAKARGDQDADEARFTRAKVAFMVEWKK